MMPSPGGAPTLDQLGLARLGSDLVQVFGWTHSSGDYSLTERYRFVGRHRLVPRHLAARAHRRAVSWIADPLPPP